MPGKKRESKTSPRRISIRERQQKALEYRKAGFTYQKIADQLNYKNASCAEHAVKAAMDRITEQPAKEVRKLELERLDAILTTLWAQVAKGHLGAVDRVLKIMDRRARYLGLDMPVKHALTDPEGEDSMILSQDEIIARLKAILEESQNGKAVIPVDSSK